jgi:hypothetical protein
MYLVLLLPLLLVLLLLLLLLFLLPPLLPLLLLVVQSSPRLSHDCPIPFSRIALKSQFRQFWTAQLA